MEDLAAALFVIFVVLGSLFFIVEVAYRLIVVIERRRAARNARRY